MAVAYLIFGSNWAMEFDAKLDFLYTFVFFCSAFIVGELLQTLAHGFEWIIDLFFRSRRPSQVFLYKNNPVLKNEFERQNIFDKLNLTSDDRECFDKQYSELPILPWKRNNEDDTLSQRMFWKCYIQVSDVGEVITSNRNYLFVRVMMVVFFIVSILLFIDRNIIFGAISIGITLLFLWRSRGLARGLVFKTVLLSMKERKSE